VLLILVFGVLLVLVGITATAQAVMVSAYASASTLTAVVDSDVATIRGFVHQGLDDVHSESPDPATTTASTVISRRCSRRGRSPTRRSVNSMVG